MEVRPSCNSEFEVDDRLIFYHHDHTMDVATRLQTPLTNINVRESTNIHIGPKIISVTQNVDNIEVLQGRILGLELVTPQNSTRQRLSIALCVCWTLLVASVLVFFIFYFALAKDLKRLDLDIQEPWYLRRPYWYANPANYITFLKLPVSRVIIGHSAGIHDFCEDKYDCIQIVLDLQKEHQTELRWPDIAANFLVSGDGLIFEGRGANVEGGMMRSFDRQSISIMFLGNYLVNEPNEEQFDNVNVLLGELVRMRVLTEDYELFGHCQAIGSIVTPGPNIMDELFHFPHWKPVNITACLRSL